MENALSLDANIGEVVRRRLPLGVKVALALFVIVVALALLLPSIYKSRAVILIEAQEIPQDLVRSLVTGYADQRIQIIAQRVLTNSNLSTIIDKFDLYAEELESEPMEFVLEEMREDISVEPISVDVVDQRSGKPTKSTIAVELSFESKSPDIAQRVSSELLSLFLNENLKQRAETATDTLAFLRQESEKLREQVAELEFKLAEFKERKAGQLPELRNLNVQLMHNRENDLVQVETQLRSLESQRIYLESELAQQDPTTQLYSETGQRILGPADRLKVLESEFIPLASRYGDSHPDVVAKRKEIESLRAQVGGSSSKSEVLLKLKESQTRLAEMRERYSEEHPDIKALNREIESLTSRLDSTADTSVTYRPQIEQKPDNPVYFQLQARLEATKTEAAALRERRARLQDKITELENRLVNAPQVEREFQMLSRDYETAQAKYREVLAKTQEAELARSLESEQKGERFTLIEPPVVPETPDKPNRVAILLLGLLLSLAGGIAVSALAETVDDRIYGRSGVVRALGVPPLAIIPQFESEQVSLASRSLKYGLGIGLLVAVVAIAIHFMYRPIDVLFFQALRVIGF